MRAASQVQARYGQAVAFALAAISHKPADNWLSVAAKRQALSMAAIQNRTNPFVLDQGICVDHRTRMPRLF
jgi:uncharacterized phage-associated protein